MINLIPTSVIDDYVIITPMIMAPIITTMVVIIITTIYANCHNCCKSKPGRVIPVIIRWSIRHIGR